MGSKPFHDFLLNFDNQLTDRLIFFSPVNGRHEKVRTFRNRRHGHECEGATVTYKKRGTERDKGEDSRLTRKSKLKGEITKKKKWGA